MDKDKVIELAKRAQIGDSHGHMIRHEAENLVAFAQLVRDDYRAELLAGSGEPVAFMWKVKHPLNAIGDPIYGEHISVSTKYREGSTNLHTADQQAAAVLRERDEATHWKNKCRKIIRTYLVDDEAWDPEKETDEKLALHSMGAK